MHNYLRDVRILTITQLHVANLKEDQSEEESEKAVPNAQIRHFNHTWEMEVEKKMRKIDLLTEILKGRNSTVEDLEKKLSNHETLLKIEKETVLNLQIKSAGNITRLAGLLAKKDEEISNLIDKVAEKNRSIKDEKDEVKDLERRLIRERKKAENELQSLNVSCLNEIASMNKLMEKQEMTTKMFLEKERNITNRLRADLEQEIEHHAVVAGQLITLNASLHKIQSDMNNLQLVSDCF